MTIHTRDNQGDPVELPKEVRDAISKFTRTFEEFKTKNDQRLAQIEKRGGDDVVTREQVDKINGALSGMQDEIADLFKKSNRNQVVTSAEKAEIEQRHNAVFDAQFRADGRTAALDDAGKARQDYRAAATAYLRRGDKALSAAHQRALVAGSNPDGGYWVEPAMSDRIIERVRETSAMRSLAEVVTIGTNRYEMPIDRDDVGYEWVGETSTRSETSTAQTGKLEIPVHEISAMPKASQNLLDDAGVDVEGWLARKVDSRFARAENSAFVVGNGVARPKGITNYTTAATADASRAFGVLEHVVTGASADFASSDPSDALINLMMALTAPYRQNATWVMNRLTLAKIRKFKDGQGNYLWQPSFVAGQPSAIMGFPVAEFSDMPDCAAGSLPVAFGDFKSGYLIVDRQGIRVLRDPFTAKPYVLFYTTKRVGGGVTDSDAIKMLKCST